MDDIKSQAKTIFIAFGVVVGVIIILIISVSCCVARNISKRQRRRPLIPTTFSNAFAGFQTPAAHTPHLFPPAPVPWATRVPGYVGPTEPSLPPPVPSRTWNEDESLNQDNSEREGCTSRTVQLAPPARTVTQPTASKQEMTPPCNQPTTVGVQAQDDEDEIKIQEVFINERARPTCTTATDAINDIEGIAKIRFPRPIDPHDSVEKISAQKEVEEESQ